MLFNFNDKIDPGDVIAVGDIHGRMDLFDLFCDHVADSGATVILLGDLIDRGPDSLGVLDRAHYMMMSPESWGLESVTVLMGNHEYMFIDAAEGTSSSFSLWLQNGGDFDQYADMLRHLPWVKRLPIFSIIGDSLFTHAGFYPGKHPGETLAKDKQGVEKLVWMREPFLSSGPQFEKWDPNLKRVVHGHTPKGPLPYGSKSGDRICIDTAAFTTGVLTSYNVNKNTFWSYEIDAEPTPDN